MQILVDRLTETPAELRLEADSDLWRAAMAPRADLPDSLASPLELALRAYRMGDTLYLEGSLRGALELECGRCLARYRHALHEPFRLVLEPLGTRVPAEPEAAEALARDGMCLGEEVETGWYRGPEIHLRVFVHELVALALPVQPLCSEDCQGLCARCGADRNRAPCSCSEIVRDSPFAALRVLRERQREGGS